MRNLKIYSITILLLFITHYSLFITNCIAQWYPLPVFPTYLETSDVKFFDANTGVLTYYNYPGYTFGILRTTNGGLNWIYIDTNIVFYDLEKIDSNTIYAVGRGRDIIDRVLRSTNRGLTWTATAYPIDYAFHSCSFVNKDTGWVTGFDGLYKVWRTTDGGLTLTPQSTDAGRGEVFFYNKKVNGEYTGWVNNSSTLWKTTNSGNNWFQVSCPGTDLYQITFINEYTGWASIGNMYKTTNGGLNWFNQPLAPGAININRNLTKFLAIDKDTIYGAGGYRYINGNRITAAIWKTTNGGTYWGYQDIDTSFHIGYIHCIDFINSNTGYAFEGNGLKTTNGGGQITAILTNSITVNDYQLCQNYPNPFNSTSKIKYQILKTSDVQIKVFDIQGREISILVNRKQTPGNYECNFDASNMTSGIYFYQLTADGVMIATKKMIMIK